MTDKRSIGGVAVQVTDANLGSGGQGQALKAHLIGDPATELVIKTLTGDPGEKERVEALVDLQLPLLSPYLAGPLAFEALPDGSIQHLAPFASGNNLEHDRARTLPELLEVAHHLACQWTVCEDNDIAHGDVALSNVIVTDQGEASPIDFDNFFKQGAPDPQMAGQHMMLAPEIRTNQSGATVESDRFAWAVLFNMLLLTRHPTARANNPAELDRLMSTGRWPERDYIPAADETPIDALGFELPAFFDQAFDLDPAARPSADDWRRTLHAALHNIWIHNCGQAFVGDHRTGECPWCNAPVSIVQAVPGLTIIIPSTGAKFKTPFDDGASITLGRSNLGAISPAVSNRHLQITRYRDQILLRHIGRNSTLIHTRGQWFQLEDAWINASELAGTGITLKMADADIQISAS